MKKSKELQMEILQNYFSIQDNIATLKLVYDTFDKKNYNITRTQQIIMLSLSVSTTLTMSELAKKINTSNEQATRAVAQLVEKGFVVRSQNPANRRVINISLTESAREFIEKTKNNIKNDFLDMFSDISDDEMEKFYSALQTVESVLKKVM